MLNNNQLLYNQQFDRVAIADLTHFQIAIPTTTKLVKKRIFSNLVFVLERVYSSQGWLIYEQQLIAYIEGLAIGAIFSEQQLFKPIKRLAPTIPISFNTKATSPLPSQVSSQAAFSCQFTDEVYPMQAIFQNVVPRFVRIYSAKTNDSILDRVRQMLETEALFISQNYHQLKKVPFYQKTFGL